MTLGTPTLDVSRMYDAVVSAHPPPPPAEAHAEYSPRAWRRVPTLWDVAFGLQLPYRPPASPLGAFVWRKRLWLESTFALSMLQPWEKFFVWICMYTFLVVFSVLASYVLADAYTFATAQLAYYTVPIAASDALL